MGYNLIIQRSLTGYGWVTINTQAGVTPGDPFTYVDTPVPPGELRLYRARYECESDSEIHSDWAYTVGRGPYPAGDATMCNVITSAQTLLAISNPERNTGAQCKASVLMDFKTHNLNLQRGFAEEADNRNAVEETTDEGPAISRVSGPVTMSFRPGGGFERLLGTLYELQSADVDTIAADAGPPAVPEHYTKTLKPTSGCRPATIISKEGDQAFVYPGVYLNTLSFSADKKATTKIQANVELVILNQILYGASTAAELADLGLDTATYDLLTALNNTDWVLYIDNVAVGAQRFNWSFNRNREPRDVGDNTMGASCYYGLKGKTTSGASLYWENLTDLRRFWGVGANDPLPFGVKKTIRTAEVKIVFTPPDNADNYANVVTLVMPVCSIRSLVKEIPENGAIMQELTFQPRQDPANGRISHYWEITNGEDYEDLTNYGTPIPHAPKNDMSTYYAIPAQVDGGTPPTTTVFICDAQYNGTTYLSAVNDAYNGKRIRFYGNMTPALAGVEADVLDYVGATRQFTLTAALGAAPADGDIFQILSAEKA